MQGDKEYISLLKKGEYYCSKSEKCPDDLYKYLSKYSDNQDLIAKVISGLQSDDYLNTDRYIKAYVNDKFRFDKWGKIKIAYNLKQKRLPENKINEAISRIDMDAYIESLEELIKFKSSSIREKDLYKRKASIVRYCISKGFEYELIFKFLDNQ